MPRKPKTPQKENLNEVSGRDLFQTPNYATELLIPFLGRLMKVNTIWECAAGQGKIVNRLVQDGFDVIGTDLDGVHYPKLNFLTEAPLSYNFDCIVTNTPFSLKQKFYKQCRLYSKPFALLIPADYSSWIVDAVKYDGAEKIIPNRRIDYITPNILRRIWEGETWERYVYKKTMKLEEFKERNPYGFNQMMNDNKEFDFDSIYTAPAKLLRKYSSSYYHSMWLTWGFGLGRTETYVELTNEMKDNI